MLMRAPNSTQALIDLHKELLRLTAPTSSAHSSSSTPSSASSSSRQRTESVYADEVTEGHLVEIVLKLLMDEISEVKNSALSWSV